MALEGFNTGAGATFAALFAGSGVFRPDAIGTPVSTRARISATAATRYRMGEGWTAQTLSYVRRLSNAPGIRLRLRVFVTRAQEQTGARTFTVDINCAKRTILRWASAGIGPQLPRMEPPSDWLLPYQRKALGCSTPLRRAS